MINIPESDKERVVILGCGFAGLKLARGLKNSGYQVVILDRYNYHQFQPLFY
jgi:NADH:ubiquinone reductase (H+-translocating)